MSSIQGAGGGAQGVPQQQQNGIQALTEKGRFPGRKITRLHIDTNDPKSSVAMIGLKTSAGLFGRLRKKRQQLAVKSGKYIQTTIKGGADASGRPRYESVAINVNSLAKHLNLTRGQISLLHQEGNLEEVLQSVHDTTKADRPVQEFFGKGGAEKVKAKEIAVLFMRNKLAPGARLMMGNKVFRLDGNRISTEKQLGKGTFGTAYKITELAVNNLSLSEVAEKVSNMDLGDPSFATAAREDLQIEYRNLREINELAVRAGRHDVLEGLQEPPRSISYRGQQGVMRGKLYKGSLQSEVTKMSLQQKLRGFDPLLKGLGFIQGVGGPGQGLVHVDIKPDNIFVDTNDGGEPIFRLADFGGTRWANQVGGPAGSGMSHTRIFTPYGELQNAMSKNPLDVDALHRVATFQMGVTLFKSLTNGEFPYPLSIDDYQIPDPHVFNQEALAGYPREIVDFLKSMLHPDPSQRPMGDILLQSWNRLVQPHGSAQGMAIAAANAKQIPDSIKQRLGSIFDKGEMSRTGIEAELNKLGAGRRGYFLRFSPNVKEYVVSGKKTDGTLVHWPESQIVEYVFNPRNNCSSLSEFLRQQGIA